MGDSDFQHGRCRKRKWKGSCSGRYKCFPKSSFFSISFSCTFHAGNQSLYWEAAELLFLCELCGSLLKMKIKSKYTGVTVLSNAVLWNMRLQFLLFEARLILFTSVTK